MSKLSILIVLRQLDASLPHVPGKHPEPAFDIPYCFGPADRTIESVLAVNEHLSPIVFPKGLKRVEFFDSKFVHVEAQVNGRRVVLGPGDAVGLREDGTTFCVIGAPGLSVSNHVLTVE